MKSEQLNELATALAKAQSQIKHAIKESDNPFFKSKYADLTNIWESCREALNKNGLSIVQTVECASTTFDSEKTIVENHALVTMLLHVSGQFISGKCPLLSAKGDMQGLGSAISYARRYGLAAICGVTTEDDDANEASQPQKNDSPCTPAQSKMIAAKLNAKGIRGNDATTLLNKFGASHPEKIPYVQVSAVVKAIETYFPPKDHKNPPDREEEIPFDPDIAWRGQK